MTDYILPTELNRKSEALNRVMDLANEDRLDEAMKVLSTIQLTAGNLAFMKQQYGADYIRENNFDTTRADREFGDGWLDR